MLPTKSKTRKPVESLFWKRKQKLMTKKTKSGGTVTSRDNKEQKHFSDGEIKSPFLAEYKNNSEKRSNKNDEFSFDT